MPDSTTTTPQTTFDYSLPAAPAYQPTVPTGGYQTDANPNYYSSNPYGQGTKQYDVYQAYLTRLGRAPDEAGFNRYVNDPTIGNNIYDILGNSSEGQTYGRARAEVNPEIDNQIQQYYNDIATEQQKAKSQLGNLQSSYNTNYGSLTFAQQQQMDAIDALRNQINQDTGYQASQLQEKFAPAAQNAWQTANRRGLLNSSIALGLLNENYKPIQTSLANLYQTAQRQLSDAEQKRQSATQKYAYDVNALNQSQQQQIQQIKDALALYTQQQQQMANSANTQRANLINTRAGGYTDSLRQFQLQQQALQEQIRAALAGESLARDQFNYNKSKG